MEYLEIAIKILLGVSILNVWLIRANKPTPYRGGEAKTIKEEFAVYGLPGWFVVLVGIIKIALAIVLMASIYFPSIEMIGAIGLAAMMLGAVVMHLKVRDSFKKTFPALLFLVLSLAVYFL